MPRPSLKNTPLAALRAGIKIKTDIPERGKKRAGKFKEVPLSQKDIAVWLDCSVHNVQSIESGRGGLTRENTEIIVQQTGVSPEWLTGNDTKKPLNGLGRPYTQQDFDEAQLAARGNLPVLKAQMELAYGIGSLATILLRACKRGEIDLYAAKLKNALGSVALRFPKNDPFRDLNLTEEINFSKGTSATAHNFTPLIDKWNRELLRVVKSRITQTAKPDARK